MLFTCQLGGAVVVVGLVELLDDEVDEVVDPGVVVVVVEVEAWELDVVGAVDEVLVEEEGTGVTGPGLTCSPAAATICHAITVVKAVANTQTAIRAERFMP